MDDLVTWLRAALDDDERVAREASRRDDDGWTPTGEHWRWEETEHDQPLTLDPVVDEYLNDAGDVALRSVEEYETKSVGALPHFVVPYAQEVCTVDAMHIARWDPARVLAEVDAKRRILDAHPIEQSKVSDYTDCAACMDVDSYDAYPCLTVRLLALPFADRPGYLQEWAP